MQNRPQHLAIIMDGNGRWAKAHMRPRAYGHQKGSVVTKSIIEHACKIQLPVLSLFAFSKENWTRPAAEVQLLFKLMHDNLLAEKAQFIQNNIQFKWIGDATDLPADLVNLLQTCEKQTAHNTGTKLILAINYSGKWDIQNAVQNMKLVGAQDFQPFLALQGIAPPDLLIRTSGEHRISNYYLWDLCYTELFFSPKHWPEFTTDDLDAAIESFSTRERRFGGLYA